MRATKQLWRTNDERKLVEHWIAMGYAFTTMRLYLTAVRAADAWCSENGHRLRSLSPSAAAQLAQEVPNTWSSRRRLRSALTAYWEACGRRNAPVKAIRVPTKPRMQSRALEERVALELETAARLRNDRPGLAVLVGLYLGLRRAEIAGLQWSCFTDEFRWVTIVGKGNVTATLPVHPVLIAALQRLPRNGSAWVFPGRFGGSVTPTTVWEWVRNVAKDAKLDPVAAHVLRHTCLTTANDVTRDLRAVQMFARHARPDTTAGYTRVNAKRMVSVMLALDYHAVAQEAS